MSLIKSHGNIFLRNILPLYDVAEPAFCDWITTTSVIPISRVLSLLFTSSSLVSVVVVPVFDIFDNLTLTGRTNGVKIGQRD